MIDEQKNIALKQVEQQASRSHKKRDVMSSLTIFGGLVELCLIIAAATTSALWLSIVLVVIAVGVIVFYACMYWYWAKSDPDRLQSEEFNLASKAIGLLEGRDSFEISPEKIAAVHISGTIPFDEKGLTKLSEK